MKITKTEKIWLIAVIILYICYNLPFVPAYGQAKATLIHAAITLIPLWIVIYVGLFKVCRIYRIKENNDNTDHADNTDITDIADNTEIIDHGSIADKIDHADIAEKTKENDAC